MAVSSRVVVATPEMYTPWGYMASGGTVTSATLPAVRTIKAGVIAAALAAATMTATGTAGADEPAPGGGDETISVDITLLGCSIGAGLGTDLALALAAGQGSSATVDSGLVARLRAAGCLPWR